MENVKNKKVLSQEDIMKILDACYRKAMSGIDRISPPIEQFAADYQSKNEDAADAARKMIRMQVAKCTTSGVVNGFGGIIALPVAVPANIGSVLYVQMRMIACTAYLAGYDVRSDQVQTLVYACLADFMSLASLFVSALSIPRQAKGSLKEKRKFSLGPL